MNGYDVGVAPLLASVDEDTEGCERIPQVHRLAPWVTLADAVYVFLDGTEERYGVAADDGISVVAETVCNLFEHCVGCADGYVAYIVGEWWCFCYVHASSPSLSNLEYRTLTYFSTKG